MLPPNIISEIHGKLVDQGTGEPTGLNQAFDELLDAYEEEVCKVFVQIFLNGLCFSK